jgi:hypothetical protein
MSPGASAAKQKTLLVGEGHKVVKKGKTSIVVDFEKYVAKL